MASRSLGTLTYSLVAEIGGFEGGMSKAGRVADRKAKVIESRLEAIGTKAVVVGNLIGEGLSSAITSFANKLPELIGKLDALDEMAEKIGIATEELSALRYAGEAAGTSFEQLGAGMSKLARLMAEAAGGNKEAQATFSAMNVEIKNTDGALRATADVLTDIASRFAGYEDGAEKAAFVTRIFGKSGEDMIPLLNQGAVGIARLSEEAKKLGAVYSGDLAKAAADFNDNLTKIKIASEAASISISGGLIKSLANLSTEFVEAKKNGGLFAAGMQSYFSGVKAFWEGRLFNGEAAKKSTQQIQDYVNALGGPSAGGGRGFVNPKVVAPVVQDPTKPPKTPRSGGANTAAQEAAAQLAADLAAFKNTMEAMTGGYKNQMQILEALRSAGLKDEGEYYAEKIRLTKLTNAAQEEALAKEIERLQQEKLSGKDAINTNKQIADVQAKLTKAQQDGATAVKVLGIESEAAYTRTKSAILSARQAAQDFYDTTVKGYQRQLEGLGMGTKFREFQGQIQAIEDNYQRQRQDLANQRAQAELIGPLSAQARKEYDERLAIINEFQGKAVDSFTSTYAQIEEAQKSWLVGASEALRNYADEASNVAKHMEDTVGNALKGFEDQLVNLFTGKKFDAKALFDSITTDLTRNFVKENITGPAARWLADSFGINMGSDSTVKLGTQSNPMFVRLADSLNIVNSSAGGGSGGGWLSTLIGGAASLFGGFSNSIAAPLANALPGDALDNLLRITANFGGFRAAGGPVAPNTLYRVNERGPELFVADGGAQMLLTGAQGGNIVPNGGFGNGFAQTNNITVQGSVDRRTAEQIAAELGRRTRTAMYRMG